MENLSESVVKMPWQRSHNPSKSKKVDPLENSPPGRSSSFAQQRITLLNKLPLPIKNHMVAAMSEFAGTFMFLLFAFGGTQAVNIPVAEQLANDEGTLPSDIANNPAKLLYISLCFGMSLAVNAWVFFRISGGLFNPAVTMAMMIVGMLDLVRGPLIIVSQLLGGMAAAGVVEALTPGPLAVRTKVSPDTNLAQAVFIEMFLTAGLVFTIFMLAAEKHRATFIAPVGIGLCLFIAELMGVYYTGGSLNPARSFGPAVVSGFDSDHWVYWVGPILGGLVASGFYLFVKALEYETANPNADAEYHHGDDGSQMLPETSRSEKPVSPRGRPGSHGSEVTGTVGRNSAAFADGPGLESGDGPRTMSRGTH